MRELVKGAEWDLVISDYDLPGSGGDETLAVLREEGLDIPFLLVSGTIGEELAAAVMQAGASDYLEKGSLTRLVPVIERELAEAGRRREAREASAALELARVTLLGDADKRAPGLRGLEPVRCRRSRRRRCVADRAAGGRAGGTPCRRRRSGPPLVRPERDVLQLLAATGADSWKLLKEIDPGEMESFRHRQPTIQNEYQRFGRASPRPSRPV